MKILKFECKKCGLCCREKNFIITLTHLDVLRIYYQLKLSSINELLEVVAFFEVDINNKELLKRIIYPPILLNGKYYILGLNKNKDNSCVYLKDNKCKIYNVRPNICKIFPFTFNIESNKLKIQINLIAKEKCQGLNKGQLVDLKYLKRLWKQIMDEKAEYNKLIELWNNLVINKILDSNPVMFLNFILGNIDIKI